jgi:hypothetical protein
MAGERRPGHDDRGPGRRSLDEPRAAKSLGGPLAATARDKAEALFDPHGNLPKASDVTQRDGRDREEGC